MRFYSTKEYAGMARVSTQTIRFSHCVNGHYLTVKPVKMPNRFLAWPADDVDRVLFGSAAKQAKA